MRKNRSIEYRGLREELEFPRVIPFDNIHIFSSGIDWRRQLGRTAEL